MSLICLLCCKARPRDTRFLVPEKKLRSAKPCFVRLHLCTKGDFFFKKVYLQGIWSKSANYKCFWNQYWSKLSLRGIQKGIQEWIHKGIQKDHIFQKLRIFKAFGQNLRISSVLGTNWKPWISKVRRPRGLSGKSKWLWHFFCKFPNFILFT